MMANENTRLSVAFVDQVVPGRAFALAAADIPGSAPYIKAGSLYTIKDWVSFGVPREALFRACAREELLKKAVSVAFVEKVVPGRAFGLIAKDMGLRADEIRPERTLAVQAWIKLGVPRAALVNAVLRAELLSLERGR